MLKKGPFHNFWGEKCLKKLEIAVPLGQNLLERVFVNEINPFPSVASTLTFPLYQHLRPTRDPRP
jgi:hypothetical protein